MFLLCVASYILCIPCLSTLLHRSSVLGTWGSNVGTWDPSGDLGYALRCRVAFIFGSLNVTYGTHAGREHPKVLLSGVCMRLGDEMLGCLACSQDGFGWGLPILIPPLSTEGTGPSATPRVLSARMAAASPSSRSAECRVEWSWLHQTPHLRAGFEEGFQQALGGGNRPLGWEMGNAAFVLSTDEDGSQVWPDSRGIWIASVIEVGRFGRERRNRT